MTDVERPRLQATGGRPVAPFVQAAASRLAASRTFTQLAVIAGIALFWEVVGRLIAFPLIPPFSSVAGAMVELLGQARFQADAGQTLLTFALGFLPAVVFGIGLGVLMGRFSIVETSLDPYVNAFVSMPMSALVPILLLLLGYGLPTRVVVVFMFATWVIVIATMNGIKSTDRALIEMAHSFGANRRTILGRIAIPSALPLILGGVRVGIGRAVGGALIAEILTTLSGVGGRLESFGAAFRISHVYAIVVLVTLTAWFATELVFRAESRLSHWRQR